MRIGVDLGTVAPGDSARTALLRGVLGCLLADHPGQDAVLFCTPANVDLFSCLPGRVERVVLPGERFVPLLDRQAARRGLHVLFRAGPAEAPSSFPLSRQVVFIPDLRHQYFWEFFDEQELARRYHFFRLVLEGAGALAVPSEGVRQSVRALCPSRDADVFRMSPAIPADGPLASAADLTAEERGQLPRGDFFLYPARLAPHKNHRRLLQAFDSFLRGAPGPFEMVLTGDPAGWPELAARFPGLPVRHLGRVRPEFLQVLYQRATALAYFSLYEGFGLPLLEAFHAGAAVVCSNTFGLPEVAGDAALTCDPTDVGAMSEALRRAAVDRELRGRLAARGRERLARYRWEDGAGGLLGACRRVAGARPALSPAGQLARGALGRVRGTATRVGRRARRWLGPWLDTELGVMRQHPPRPIRLPARYGRVGPPDPAPVLSVVTPSYNQGAFLERTMRSVLDQGYPRLEYVVQDGGSTDGTRALLERYADRLTHWESRPDRGQAHAINLGFGHATGEVLAYLNSDDLLLPGSLAYVARYFASHPEVDVVYGHRLVVDEEDRETARWVLPPHDNAFITWDDFIPQETMFWRRRIWQRVGCRLDETFHFALDWDLILRFRDAGARFVRLPRFLGAFRNHARQKTMTLLETYYAEVRRLRERSHGGPVPLQHILAARGPYLGRQVLYQRLHGLGLLGA